MAYTKDQLLQWAMLIRDETAAGANTASRVGGLLYNLIRSAITDEELEAVADRIVEMLGEVFIYKDREDQTEFLLKLLGGVQIGNFITGMIFGTGAQIDSSGAAELDSLVVRKFLEVPELRYNRVSVYTGVAWQTFGAGLIESVEIDTDTDGSELQSGTITLKLEDGEYGMIEEDDLCMGIWHEYDGDNDDYAEDQRNGNFHFKGFHTVYFRVDEILDELNHSKFHYVLRGKSENWTQQYHPAESMHFACYANPTNTDRQRCKYSTTEYEIRLRDMTDWEYGEANIYYICGLLKGFSLSGQTFEDTGVVIENGYFSGVWKQFENIPYKMEVSTDGDTILAYNDTTTITCTVTHAFFDVTSLVTEWTVTRESGMQEEDDAWNADHTDFDGTITIGYADLGINYGTYKTMFRFTAKIDTDTVAAYELTFG